MDRHWVREAVDAAIENSSSVSDDLMSDLNRIIEIVEGNHFYHYRTAKLQILSEEISECDDLEALSQIIWSAAISCGMQHATIFLIRQGNYGAFKRRVVTSMPEPWLRHYSKNSFQFIDPVIISALKSKGHFLFSDTDRSSEEAQAFWSDAEKFQIGSNGFCFTHELSCGAVVAVSFSSQSNSSRVRKKFQRHGADLEILTFFAVEAFSQLCRKIPPQPDLLSKKELLFLYTLVQSDDPSEVVNMNLGFGGNKTLQNSIRQKLGVKTIFQAISLASKNHWFDSLEYQEEQVAPMIQGLLGMDLLNETSIVLNEGNGSSLGSSNNAECEGGSKSSSRRFDA